MSGEKNHQVDGALARARQAAALVKPLARSTGEAAKRGVHATRAWAAPQIERTGKAVQENIAPKVSALLSSAARQVEPTKPRHRRWRKVAGASALTAAAGAVTGAVLNRRKQNGSAEEDADQEPESHDEQAAASTPARAEQNEQVKTS